VIGSIVPIVHFIIIIIIIIPKRNVARFFSIQIFSIQYTLYYNVTHGHRIELHHNIFLYIIRTDVL